MNEKDWKKEWEALYAQFVQKEKEDKAIHHGKVMPCPDTAVSKENKEKK